MMIIAMNEAILRTSGDGKKYPSKAYLYVPDPKKPDTWKIRVKEYVNGVLKVTRRQLGLAAAAFSPGGFRGKRVQFPSGLMSTMKTRMRRLYRSLGVADKLIPSYLKEQAEPIQEGTERIQDLFEGPFIRGDRVKIDEEGGMIHNVPMLGPRSKNGRRYPLEVMREAVQRGVYESLPMFFDHKPKESSRSVRDLGGEWVGTSLDEETSRVRGNLKVREKYRTDIFDLAKNFPEQVAPSHVVEGKVKVVKEGEEKVQVVERILKGYSVDLVVGAATVNSFTESKENIMGTKDEITIENITLEELQTMRPELFADPEPTPPSNAPSTREKELEKENQELKEKEAARDRKEKSEGFLDDALKKSPLSDDAKTFIREGFEGDLASEEDAEKYVRAFEEFAEKQTGEKLGENLPDLPAPESPLPRKNPKGMTLSEALKRRAGIPVKKEEKKKEE